MVTQTNPTTALPWYGQTAREVLAAFPKSSVAAGLSSEVAQRHLERYGLNVLPDAPRRSRLGLFLSQFRSLPVALLTVAAGISVFATGWADALVIIGVVLINSLIGYATESQAERILRSLQRLGNLTAWVRRAGETCEIDAAAVVPGDILMLRPGSSIAADGRLLEVHELTVDESALTGESLPVVKTVAPLPAGEVPLGDRANMVYRGTLVTGGQGLALVVATGPATEMGQIQTLVGQTTPPPTPMEQQLERVGRQLVWLSSAVCGVVFGLGLWRGYPLVDMLTTSVALAVAAVPEGLPAVATTTLALGIQAMRQQRVLVRRLDAIETLGSLQTLCLDKTGTLTSNHMAVVELHTDHTHWQRPAPLLPDPAACSPDFPLELTEPLLTLLRVVVLCNESEVDNSTADSAFTGSATENALLEFARQAGVDLAQLRQEFPRVGIQHRSAQHNLMKTLHRPSSGQGWVAVKGNPVEVLTLCSHYLNGTGVMLLSETQRRAIAAANERMASHGHRILGVAYAETTSADLSTAVPLTWLGLVGLADPLRPGVPEAIASFHRAGIATVMVTGDQKSTAQAIGQALNLSQGKELRILDTPDLSDLSLQQALERCRQVDIFARISPAHKLQVVQALQRTGQVVAMTGDGINDAPALRAAQVGIAMGTTGTDVAREVADVVLEDDNLATMILAIRQGRTIYSNIRKAVHFLLATNLSEILVMFAGLSLGLGQPLNALQLLWLNLVTDIFPGLALALEPAAANVLDQPPRDPAEAIIQPATFKRLGLEAAVLAASTLAAYTYAIWRYGIGPQASTLGFMSLTLAQLLHALSCRSESRCVFGARPLPPNRHLAIALTLSITLQCSGLFVPILGQLLHITPLNWLDASVITSSALLPLAINEATKGKTTKDAAD